MRHIGQLSDEAQARLFSDFLVGCGVPNHVEHDEGSWTVWITNDDHVATAQGWFVKFRANPDAEEFRKAGVEAARVRKAEAEDLASYRRRIHTRKSLFPRFGGYGVGILTYALILVCAAVAMFTQLGRNLEATSFFLMDDLAGTEFLQLVRHGEVWRLLSPIVLHFGIAHIIFNLVALYQLGCMIEARQSTWMLAALVVVLGLGSNLAQYTVSFLSDGHPFGGMSGVVYGLIGYIWMRGKFDRTSGLAIDRTYLFIALGWFVACYVGLIGNVANSAHAAGLVLGMLWGRLAAYQKARRPE